MIRQGRLGRLTRNVTTCKAELDSKISHYTSNYNRLFVANIDF